ncbi:MAG: hypothetical protein ACRENG_01155 [bacterium]
MEIFHILGKGGSHGNSKISFRLLALACSLDALSDDVHQRLRQELVGVIQMIAKLIKGVDKPKAKNPKNDNDKVKNGKKSQTKEDLQE